MQYLANADVPIGNLTSEVAQEHEGEIPLDITIAFNGETQFSGAVILPFEYQNSVPETVITDPTANKEVKYYNVFGQPVTNTYKGVVITSDGKKLLLR